MEAQHLGNGDRAQLDGKRYVIVISVEVLRDAYSEGEQLVITDLHSDAYVLMKHERVWVLQ